MSQQNKMYHTHKANWFNTTNHEMFEYERAKIANVLKVSCWNCSHTMGFHYMTPGNPKENKYEIFKDNMSYRIRKWNQITYFN